MIEDTLLHIISCSCTRCRFISSVEVALSRPLVVRWLLSTYLKNSLEITLAFSLGFLAGSSNKNFCSQVIFNWALTRHVHSVFQLSRYDGARLNYDTLAVNRKQNYRIRGFIYDHAPIWDESMNIQQRIRGGKRP